MGAPVRVGDVIAEKYEVTRVLGMGGMGVVVAARHALLDKLVALKFMHEEVAGSEAAVDRFLREARAAARLQNEHVAHVLDVGRLDNGVPYIVMEYLEGKDLAQLLEERGELDVPEVVEYVLQTCEAMAEAHANGIVHRDLKPQNLFLTFRQDGRPLVKVLDFGISKLQELRGHTATQQAIGTPTYMAPEQMRSARSVDARADIWSLGVILYQLLANALPFLGETIPEVMFAVMSEAPRPLTRAVPTSLIRVIERCLEKDRERRFSNVAELAQELVPFAPERARAAISLIERVVAAGMPESSPRPADAPGLTLLPQAPSLPTTLGSAVANLVTVPPRRPPRWWHITIPIVVLLFLGGIVVLAFRDGTTVGPASTPVDKPLSPSTEGLPTRTSRDAAFSFAVAPDAMQADAALPDAPQSPRSSGRVRAHVDGGPHTSADAMITAPQNLEPAKTDDQVLAPAKENP